MKKYLLILLSSLIFLLCSGPFKGRNTPSYVVTGSLTPDVTGIYYKAGLYQGNVYYRDSSSSWFIWWYGYWYINQNVGSEEGVTRWLRDDPNITGEYSPQFGASGTATVSLP